MGENQIICISIGIVFLVIQYLNIIANLINSYRYKTKGKLLFDLIPYCLYLRLLWELFVLIKDALCLFKE